MNPLLSVLVQLGIIDASTADRLNAQLTPEQARTYAEAQLSTAFTGGLQGQYERVLQFVARQPQATQAQWDGFWQQENAALWASVGPTMTQLASDGAIVATLASGNPDNWQTVNQKVVDWTRDYYATSNEYGSIPNLNQTARQEVGDAVIAWNRGELSSRLGLPSLALELQPTFGERRAQVIAVTEYTRIVTQTKIVEAEADEFIEYYRWMTAADEIVCPQCGPLHGTIVSKSKSGGFVQPGGGAIGFPPRHPNCRCDIAFETALTKDVPLRDSFKYQPPKPKDGKPTKTAEPKAVAPVALPMLTAPDVRDAMIKQSVNDTAEAARLRAEADAIIEKAKPLQEKASSLSAEVMKVLRTGADVPEDLQRRKNEAYAVLSKEWDVVEQKREAARNLQRQITEKARKMLYVDSPAKTTIDVKSRVAADVRDKWNASVSEFNKLVGSNVIGEDVIPVKSKRGRANFNLGTQTVNVSPTGDDVPVLIHEFGHWLEFKSKDVHDSALAFYDRRTAGETPKWLGKGYGHKEVTRKDKFLHPYIGKDYGRIATEVVSMGLEYMYRDPLKLATDDPDYFDFMFNLLRGNNG